MPLTDYLPAEFLELYEVHNYRHAAEVLATGCPEDFKELVTALSQFRITTADILAKGGNESQIPKRLSSLLRPLSWYETRIRGDLVVTVETHAQGGKETVETRIDDFIDGHKVDFVKNRVAFDLEWNSKDQTFDRDLYAFRAFHEAGVISAAVLLTRSADLNEVFRQLKIMPKYGASTTWMGKLLYRMKAGRNGGCPVLVLGITQKLIEDWPQ
ncbi:BglII/BstYI family type II restriction endonuclease [Azonexus sp.]|uniref:BglII/BstYI family type II restriction endonuclease n=1 Tax=Azonexus sp. TaxID=1872668 RepID=UPI0039E3E1A6